MEYSAQNKAAGQKNQGNNWMRTLITNSTFSLAIIHVLNLLTKATMCHCSL